MGALLLEKSTLLPTHLDGLAARSWSVSLVGDAIGWFTDAPAPPPEGQHTWRSLIARVRTDGSVIKGPKLSASTPWVYVRDLPCARYLVLPSRQPAYVVDESGSVLAHPELQGEIADICVNTSGTAWVGFDDQGAKIGGLSLFDQDFVERLEHWSSSADGMGSWCCYALNGSESEVWCVYYTEFDITRVLVDGTEQRWTVDFPGARAIAVSGDIVALLSGYNHRESQCIVVRLFTDGSSAELRRYDISLNDGALIDCRVSVFGRGATLHVFGGDRWYRTTISELLVE